MRCLAGISFSTLALGSDSWGDPLLGFNSPLRFVPETSVLHLSVQDNSHGISSPSAHTGSENSRPPRLTGLALRPDPKARSVCRRVPDRQLRRRSQAFSTSQRLTALSALLPFSDRWHSWGSPFRELFLPRSLRRLVAVRLPSCRSSRRLRNLEVLGPRFLWARDPVPRMARHHAIYRLQGLRPRGSQTRFEGT
jgi:hypothetical protein